MKDTNLYKYSTIRPLFPCCFLLLSSYLPAQQNPQVEIMVMDSISKAAVSNAIVKISVINNTIILNTDGYCAIKLKPGIYEVTVSAVGFRTKTITVTVVDGKKTKSVIQLKAINSMLEDVTIVGLSKEDAEAREVKRKA